MPDDKKGCCDINPNRCAGMCAQLEAENKELKSRITFNPDWLQCSEDAKRIYGEIKEECHSIIKEQELRIAELEAMIEVRGHDVP